MCDQYFTLLFQLGLREFDYSPAIFFIITVCKKYSPVYAKDSEIIYKCTKKREADIN